MSKDIKDLELYQSIKNIENHEEIYKDLISLNIREILKISYDADHYYHPREYNYIARVIINEKYKEFITIDSYRFNSIMEGLENKSVYAINNFIYSLDAYYYTDIIEVAKWKLENLRLERLLNKNTFIVSKG